MLGRAQFGAEAAQGRGRDGGGEIRRQLAAGGGLHLGEHVGGTPAGEIARDNIRRQRETGPHELLGYNGSCQRLAIDENAVAIEDDHEGPRCTAGRSGPLTNNVGRITDANGTRTIRTNQWPPG